MKAKNIRITIRDMKDVLQEFAVELSKARKGERIVPRNELSFQNIDTLRKVLTEKRIELLHVIRKYSPDSIYELAKIVNRDLKSVNVDIDVLVSLGLVSIKKIKEERMKTRPRVEFDKLNVEIAI